MFLQSMNKVEGLSQMPKKSSLSGAPTMKPGLLLKGEATSKNGKSLFGVGGNNIPTERRSAYRKFKKKGGWNSKQ